MKINGVEISKTKRTHLIIDGCNVEISATLGNTFQVVVRNPANRTQNGFSYYNRRRDLHYNQIKQVTERMVKEAAV